MRQFAQFPNVSRSLTLWGQVAAIAKRSKLRLFVVSFVLALLLIPLTYFGMGSARSASALKSVASVFDIMQNRSPGNRVALNLTKVSKVSKLSKVAGADRTPGGPAAPHERALGKIFGPNAEGAGPGGALDSLAAGPLTGSDLTSLGLLAPDVSTLVLGPGIGSPGANVGNGGGIGGGAGGGGFGGTLFPPSPGNGAISVTPPVTSVTPPISAPTSVPEPSTWMMMIIGLGFCGFTLRRARGTGAAQVA